MSDEIQLCKDCHECYENQLLGLALGRHCRVKKRTSYVTGEPLSVDCVTLRSEGGPTCDAYREKVEA